MRELCPNEESIAAFVGGHADDDLRTLIERHVDACSSCAALMIRLLSRTGEQLHTTVGVGRSPARPMRRALTEGEKFGKYLILNEVGSGGMGTVYAAYDPDLDRKVALKLVAEDAGEGALGRLLAEATSMAKLNHPNVVTVFDGGMVEGEPYIAMELVEGQTLAQWRERKPRSQREVLKVMASAAEGIAAAHAAGIVHRDIKPQNILIAGDRVLVTDFGLSVTSRGGLRGVVGTPGYMAPEQFTGAPVDERTDVFAFCATVYQMLSGRLPFSGKTLAELERQVLAGELEDAASTVLAKLPARLRRALIQGLSTDPSARPRNFAGISEILRADPRRTRLRVLGVATGASLLVGSFALATYSSGTPARRCLAGGAALSATWDAAAKRKIVERYTAIGQPLLANVLLGRLDEYARQWRAMHTDACAATHSENRQSQSMFDLRMMCLEGRRVEFETFVTGLGKATEAQLIPAATPRLGDIGECGPAGRAGQKPLPTDPTLRAQVVEGQKELARSMALTSLGDLRGAEKSAEAALAKAQKLPYLPLRAQGFILAARAKSEIASSEDLGPAAKNVVRSYLQEAIELAERSGDERSRLTASWLLVEYYSTRSAAETNLWLAISAALLERLGNPPEHVAYLEMMRGVLLVQQMKRGDARVAFDKAIRIREQLPNSVASHLIISRHWRCAAEDRESDRVACYERMLPAAIATLGAHHPQIAVIYNNMAAAMTSIPTRREEACALLQRAAGIVAKIRDDRHRSVLMGELNVATCLVQVGKVGEAQRIVAGALSRGAAVPVIRMQARAVSSLASFLDGRLAAAEAHAKVALAEAESLFGPVHSETLGIVGTLADLQTRQGRPKEALQRLNERLAAASSAHVNPLFGLLHLRKGEALLALGDASAAAAVLDEGLKSATDNSAQGQTLRAVLHARIGKSARLLASRQRELKNLEQALALARPEVADARERAEISLELATSLAKAKKGGRVGRISAAAGRRACSLATGALTGLQRYPRAYTGQMKVARTLITGLEARGLCSQG